MIDNLNKYTVVCFDFDDTVYIWRHHKLDEGRNVEYFLYECNPDNIYTKEKGFIPDIIKKTIVDLLDNGIQVYLLSHVWTTEELKMKEELIVRDIDRRLKNNAIGVSMAEYKIDVIKGIAKKNNLSLNQICLIDDRLDTLKLCKENGITAYTPLEVFLT